MGGTGFIGSHFVQILVPLAGKVTYTYKNEDNTLLLNQSHIKGVRVDLLNSKDVDNLCASGDLIINCGAIHGNTEFRIEHSTEIVDVNTKITLNILAQAQKHTIKDVVLLSSAEIYMNPTTNPIIEEDDYRKHYYQSVNEYTMSKQLIEILGNFFTQKYNMNILIPRPANIYGPGDFSKKGGVISQFIQNIHENKKIAILSNGSQSRSFIYVEDFVKGVLNLIESGSHGVINIGTKESMSIIDLATLIGELLGKTPNLRFDTTKTFESRVLNVDKFYSLIKFTPLNLREGLEQTIHTYLSQRS